MAVIRAVIRSCLLPSTSGSTAGASYSSRRMIHLPVKARSGEPTTGSTGRVIRELNIRNGFVGSSPMHRLHDLSGDMASVVVTDSRDSSSSATEQMYSILEAIADRVEMHKNIGEQRDNWNALLLNSINMMTLTATTMVGLGAGEDSPLALKLSSVVLFAAATGMLLLMNKIQPSQLAEEQRNAVRLFKQLETEMRSRINIRDPTQADVDKAMERVLALDKAYPLPLLGAMIEKFPKKFEPATWWPKTKKASSKNNHFPSTGARAFLDQTKSNHSSNGWSEELEVEMRAIVDVLKSKDEEDYLRLGNIALKTNKAFAISGPALTGIAAVASAFAGNSGAAAVAAVAGSLAAAVNAMEHGGQVGMVVEMYRNCAGFFQLTAESIEETLEENDTEMRENGELFEMKVALKLGRSLSQLRDLARKSIYSGIEGTEIDEFGSKLF